MLKITWQRRRTLLGVSLITSSWSKNQNLHSGFSVTKKLAGDFKNSAFLSV